jgi:hypothetical protein
MFQAIAFVTFFTTAQKEINTTSVFQTAMVLPMLFSSFSALTFEYHSTLAGLVVSVSTL